MPAQFTTNLPTLIENDLTELAEDGDLHESAAALAVLRLAKLWPFDQEDGHVATDIDGVIAALRSWERRLAVAGIR